MLEELRTDIIIRQKKGLHFIIGSVLVWLAVLIVHLTNLPVLTKNLLTFFSTAPLIPIALLVSKYIKVDFQSKGNPLSTLGLLFLLNQLLYLLIAMWVFPVVPDNFLMVMAMIFGAHLLPFSWLYRSISYLVLSIVISFTALAVGIFFSSTVVAAMMLAFEILLVFLLVIENKGIESTV